MAIPYTQDWSAGNSLFTSVEVYRRTVDGVDPLYPEMYQSESVTISGGRLDYNPTYGAGVQVAGIYIRDMGELGDGYWNGHEGQIIAPYIPSSDGVNPAQMDFAPLICIPSANGIGQPRLGIAWDVARDVLTWWMEAFGGDIFGDVTDAAARPVAGQAYVVRVCWRCGTIVGNFDSVASDGYLRIYVNDVEVVNQQNVPVFLRANLANNNNYVNGVFFGYFGLIGSLGTVQVSDVACTAPTPTDETSICGCSSPGDDVGAGGGGPDNGAIVIEPGPTIGVQLGCVGEGEVDQVAELTYAEAWWGYA